MKRSALKPKRPKAQSSAALKRKATALHSRYVRARDGHCVRCGSTKALQCAHIIGRRAAYTRTDDLNAATLCAACHWHLTEWPHEHVAFFTAYLGGPAEYQALVDKARAGLGLTLRAAWWEDEIVRLQGLLDGLS